MNISHKSHEKENQKQKGVKNSTILVESHPARQPALRRTIAQSLGRDLISPRQGIL